MKRLKKILEFIKELDNEVGRPYFSLSLAIMVVTSLLSAVHFWGIHVGAAVILFAYGLFKKP